jgi:hypothetical protein
MSAPVEVAARAMEEAAAAAEEFFSRRRRLRSSEIIPRLPSTEAEVLAGAARLAQLVVQT